MHCTLRSFFMLKVHFLFRLIKKWSYVKQEGLLPESTVIKCQNLFKYLNTPHTLPTPTLTFHRTLLICCPFPGLIINNIMIVFNLLKNWPENTDIILYLPAGPFILHVHLIITHCILLLIKSSKHCNLQTDAYLTYNSITQLPRSDKHGDSLYRHITKWEKQTTVIGHHFN